MPDPEMRCSWCTKPLSKCECPASLARTSDKEWRRLRAVLKDIVQISVDSQFDPLDRLTRINRIVNTALRADHAR